MRLTGLLAAAALAISAWPAGATTYLIGGPISTVGPITVSGFITTDGTIGALKSSEITDWNILLTDGSSSLDLTGPLSGGDSFLVYSAVGALTASATQLSFNFGSGDDVFFLDSSTFAGLRLDGTTAQELASIVFTTNWEVGQSGETGIAGTPEPATWALILAGFAGLGAATRRSRRGASTRALGARQAGKRAAPVV